MSEGRRTAEEIQRAFRAAGQGHVFRWWKEIGQEGREALLDQLRIVNLDGIAALKSDVQAGRLMPQPAAAPGMPEYVRLPETAEETRQWQAARTMGEELLRAGKVAALTVAGGQGTRLNFDAPKGLYPIGPVSGKSLFQVHAERILATRRRYGGAVPWYIMTSDSTDEPTREYFKTHAWFGLPPQDVRFFRQGMMPALDRDFRLVLVARDKILLSPNGHGGTLSALLDTGMLEDMETRGVEEISYFQVDNALVPAADPAFLGFHRLAGTEMSSKAIWKRDPEEPIGAFVRAGGRLGIVEYSDLTPEQMRRKNAEGKLVYGLGNPAIHAIRVDFVRAETEGGARLPFHLAEKRSACLDDTGQLVQPEGKNVYKFEMFIFDALRDTKRSVILEIRREAEFAPLKNPTGTDSPETCHRDMTALYAGWLEHAGIKVPRNDAGFLLYPIEISPLLALDADELAAKVRPDLRIAGPLYLGPDSDKNS